MRPAPVALTLGLGLWAAGPASAQSPWLATSGAGTCGSGFVPTLHAGGEVPVLGNRRFRLVAENLIGGTPGVFVATPTPRLATLGPILATIAGPWPVLAAGCQADGDPHAAGRGVASRLLPIPGDPALLNQQIFLQGFFLDRSLPTLLVRTPLLGATIAHSISPSRTVIHDRLAYKAHFSWVLSDAQADALGRAIWAEHQVAGFSYLKTERFTCGGESHWIAIVRHAKTEMEFCLLPGGSFRMGDINGTGYSLELPVHWVRVPPFLMARTEVTQGQFEALMGSSPWRGELFVRIGPEHAASHIDFAAAAAFCARTGLRLPSEAEWEYACRAGTTTCHHHGENHPSSALAEYAWFDRRPGEPPEQAGAHRVGRKLPNAFGLYDMHGNQWEWVADNLSSGLDYRCAPSDGSAWSGGELPWSRIGRGGGWNDSARQCRSASRKAFPYPRIGLGFRPCASLGP